MTKKTYTIGGRQFLLPFRAGGFWVSDARGDSVCECRSREIAEALAKMLNELAGA